MAKFQALNPQKKRRYRPEYPLIPRVAPEVRVYIPAKTDRAVLPALRGESAKNTVAERRRQNTAGPDSESRLPEMLLYTQPRAVPSEGARRSAYIPRHAAPDEDLSALLQKNTGYIGRHAAPEKEEPVMEQALPADMETRMGRRAALEKMQMQPAVSEIPEPAGRSAVLRVVDSAYYGEEDTRKMHQPEETSRKSGTETLRSLSHMKRPKVAPVQRDDFLSSGRDTGCNAADIRFAAKSKRSKRDRRRIILLGLALAVTVALLAALLLPGGWLTRETPPLSTATTNQPISEISGGNSGAGALPTPTAAPSDAVTATPEVSVTPSATATPITTASPTATATPNATATPKPTSKPAVSPTVAPTQAPAPARASASTCADASAHARADGSACAHADAAPAPAPTEAPTEAPVETTAP